MRKPMLAGVWMVVAVGALTAPALGAVDLRLNGYILDDSVGGNGDGDLDPGETVDLQILVYNLRESGASLVTGSLAEVNDDTDVQILVGQTNWLDLAAGGSTSTAAARAAGPHAEKGSSSRCQSPVAVQVPGPDCGPDLVVRNACGEGPQG